MTIPDCISTVRMLLDSDHEYYYDINGVANEINMAQDLLIYSMHEADDERGLRPLYDTTTDRENIKNNTILNSDVLFPRSLIIYPDPESTVSFHAQYLDFDKYMIMVQRDGMYMTGEFPHSVYWTYVKQYPLAGTQTTIYIQEDGVNTAYTGKLSYIKRPARFDIIGNVGLAVPSEYHYTICSMAAEYINNLDVDENEKSEPVYPQQPHKFRIDNSAGVL